MRIPLHSLMPVADAELLASPGVHPHAEAALLRVLRAPESQADLQVVVIGPQGSGKSHLLWRVAAQVRQRAELRGWLPVQLAEDHWTLTSSSEFWLECVYRAALHCPEPHRTTLTQLHGHLHRETHAETLRQSCLQGLTQAAAAQGQRLLLVIDNLHRLAAQLPDPDQAEIQHTLHTTRHLGLLASAAPRRHRHPLYESGQICRIPYLEAPGIATLWQAVTPAPLPPATARPLQILTSGCARYVATAAAAAPRTTRSLLQHLMAAHAAELRDLLRDLPAQERQVCLAVAWQWSPTPTRALTQVTRLRSSHCSSLLQRLRRRGYVVDITGTGARRQYALGVRLLGLYCLLQRGGPACQRLLDLCAFMDYLYALPRLDTQLAKLPALAPSPAPTGPAAAASHYDISYQEGLHQLAQQNYALALNKFTEITNTAPRIAGSDWSPAQIGCMLAQHRLGERVKLAHVTGVVTGLHPTQPLPPGFLTIVRLLCAQGQAAELIPLLQPTGITTGAHPALQFVVAALQTLQEDPAPTLPLEVKAVVRDMLRFIQSGLHPAVPPGPPSEDPV